MTDKLSLRLVPDELWELVEPLLPAFSPRRQGGGTAPTDERAVFTAVCSRRSPRRRKPGKLHADKAYDHRELRELGA